MLKADRTIDKIVFLDKDELKMIIEYLNNDLDLKEKENLEGAREYYLNHSND
ncbi:MAG: hypothetical protein H0X03_02810 [Nitrosopumilus sp.]|nr:hypothetical protein [Nitrosopumilus sp.]